MVNMGNKFDKDIIKLRSKDKPTSGYDVENMDRKMDKEFFHMRDISLDRVTSRRDHADGSPSAGCFSSPELLRLTALYFDGTITPSDMHTLKEGAVAFSKGDFVIADPQLAADLKCIAAIEGYSEAALISWRQAVPSDLETRLDNHISMLASRSRRRGLWLRIGSAAACAALLVTAGIHIFKSASTFPAGVGQADTGTLVAAESAPSSSAADVSSVPATDPTVLIATPPAPAPPAQVFQSSAVALVTPKNSTAARDFRNKAVKASGNQENDIVLPYQLADSKVPLTVASVILPETLSPRPSAYEMRINDLAGLIIHPFDAISNTFDDIKQSLNFVNATIYDANKTAGMLSEEFLQASAAPLRSI